MCQSPECASHVEMVLVECSSTECASHVEMVGHVLISWMCFPCSDGGRSPECDYHVETVGHVSISWMCLLCWDDRRSVDQSNSCHVLNCIDLWILIIVWIYRFYCFFQTLSRTEMALVQVSSTSHCMILYSLNTQTHIIGNIGITATHCIPSFLLFMLVEWN